MTEHATAKLFKHGRSQAVRLPKEFRLPGKEVRVRRIGNAVVLEPIGEPFDMAAWWAKLDQYRDTPSCPRAASSRRCRPMIENILMTNEQVSHD